MTGPAPGTVGPLSAVVLRICDQAERRGVAELRSAVAPVRAALTEPLRVAVLGSVNAGKSTLVNALVGRSVAPTRATECTRLVTAYRYGHPELVEIHLRSREIRRIPLTRAGTLPDELGVPTEDVDHLEVMLSQQVLRTLTLVDTPGLGSLNIETSDRTAEFIGASGGAAVAATVDAVIAVFSADIRTVETDVLRRFRATSGGGPAQSPVNAFGVLSKADLLGRIQDPWPEAEELAGDFSRRLSDQLAGVAPIAGLLAETVAVGGFTESDADAVAALSTLPAAERRALLRSGEHFTGRPAPVSGQVRDRLWCRLAPYGLSVAFEAVDRGAHGAAAITAALHRASRVDALHERVTGQFARRADALKASAALARLEHLAFDRTLARPDRLWLADTVEAARLSPELHRLIELQAVIETTAGEVTLPDRLTEALLALAERDDPADRLGLAAGTAPEASARRARELSDDFRLFAFSAAPREQRIASVGHRACQLLLDQLERDRSVGSTLGASS
ncbi:dynamin family protein [Nakamurella leprariae]|uniref:Dynamin family protein n=1 Tax=Nakamurella leprariae TaxID=2803911 RepID=A0A939BXK5_9ACTN|nr:dynamin family protein [Nakamurella leprariae]MBM9468653.1 dynamin family protein [Nakamurella leprariae]